MSNIFSRVPNSPTPLFANENEWPWNDLELPFRVSHNLWHEKLFRNGQTFNGLIPIRGKNIEVFLITPVPNSPMQKRWFFLENFFTWCGPWKKIVDEISLARWQNTIEKISTPFEQSEFIISIEKCLRKKNGGFSKYFQPISKTKKCFFFAPSIHYSCFLYEKNNNLPKNLLQEAQLGK